MRKFKLNYNKNTNESFTYFKMFLQYSSGIYLLYKTYVLNAELEEVRSVLKDQLHLLTEKLVKIEALSSNLQTLAIKSSKISLPALEKISNPIMTPLNSNYLLVGVAIILVVCLGAYYIIPLGSMLSDNSALRIIKKLDNGANHLIDLAENGFENLHTNFPLFNARDDLLLPAPSINETRVVTTTIFETSIDYGISAESLASANIQAGANPGVFLQSLQDLSDNI